MNPANRRWLLLGAGFLALWIEVAYSFGAIFGGLDEPFPTVENYFHAVLDTSLSGTWLWFFVLSGLAVVHHVLLI